MVQFSFIAVGSRSQITKVSAPRAVTRPLVALPSSLASCNDISSLCAARDLVILVGCPCRRSRYIGECRAFVYTHTRLASIDPAEALPTAVWSMSVAFEALLMVRQRTMLKALLSRHRQRKKAELRVGMLTCWCGITHLVPTPCNATYT